MALEHTLLGIAGIILGIAILIKTGKWIPALIPTAIGIALILFRKEESKIEKRKDTTKSTNSKESEARKNLSFLDKDLNTRKSKK